jgi:4-hydroxy-tetrahydrodipicolinate reductase
MRIALFGQGVMGSLFRTRAEQQGHEIGLVVTSWAGEHGVGSIRRALDGHDVAVDFSAPEAVLRNAEVCALAGVPLVEGTTGWDDYFYAVREVVRELDGAFVFGSNFSTGASVFFSLVERAAEIFAAIDAYYPFVEKAHNGVTLDAIPGTASRLNEILGDRVAGMRPGPIRHVRGSHWVGFDSTSDEISLAHTTRSQEEFAAGALLAARWVIGKRGFFPFAEVVDDILCERKAPSWSAPAVGSGLAVPRG